MKNKLMIYFSATDRFNECNYRMKSVIRHAIIKTLKHENFRLPTEVSVTLCDNAYIKNLNRTHRNKDSATDVLSFPMYDFRYGDEPIVIADEPVMLGDIVISLERTKAQAEELGHSFLDELAFLSIHSMLHLLGYDHELSKEDDEAQCRAQREIKEMLNI